MNDDATSSLALSSWSPFSKYKYNVMIGPKRSLHCLSETPAKTKCSILCGETRDSSIAHHEVDTFGLNQADSARRVKESAYNLTFGKDQPEINARKDVHFNNRYSCMERSRKMHPICQILGDFSQVFIQICKDG